MSAIVFGGDAGVGGDQTTPRPGGTSTDRAYQDQLQAYRRQQASRLHPPRRAEPQPALPARRARSPDASLSGGSSVQVQTHLSEEDRLRQSYAEIVKRRRLAEPARQERGARLAAERQILADSKPSDRTCASCKGAHCSGRCLGADPSLDGGSSDSDETAFHG